MNLLQCEQRRLWQVSSECKIFDGLRLTNALMRLCSSGLNLWADEKHMLRRAIWVLCINITSVCEQRNDSFIYVFEL